MSEVYTLCVASEYVAGSQARNDHSGALVVAAPVKLGIGRAVATRQVEQSAERTPYPLRQLLVKIGIAEVLQIM